MAPFTARCIGAMHGQRLEALLYDAYVQSQTSGHTWLANAGSASLTIEGRSLIFAVVSP
jgi:hypothetical protein